MLRDIKIVSGGQTGADRAAMDFTLEVGLVWPVCVFLSDFLERTSVAHRPIVMPIRDFYSFSCPFLLIYLPTGGSIPINKALSHELH